MSNQERNTLLELMFYVVVAMLFTYKPFDLLQWLPAANSSETTLCFSFNSNSDLNSKTNGCSFTHSNR